MARLQILELPTAPGDDHPPFILVIDEWDTDSLEASSMLTDYWDAFGNKIGARGVLFAKRTINIPANDTTAYLRDNNVKPELDLKLGDQDTREANENPILNSCQARLDAQRLAEEHTGIARDVDRLAKWRDELADALGIGQGCSWDDIRNAAAEYRSELIRSENAREHLRQEREAQAAELERLRAGEEPVTDERIACTPAQWIWHWNRATAEKRLSMAAQIQDGMARSNSCFMADHDGKIEHLGAELERLRAKTRDA